MKPIVRFLGLSLCIAALNASALELVRDGKSGYSIAGNVDDPAVVLLQKYIEEMTSAKLPLVDVQTGVIPGKAIVVTSDAAKLPFSPTKLSDQGYQVKVVGSCVYLYSPGDAPSALKAKKQRKGSPRGLQFGVFGLLDEFFGCRFLTPTAEVVPRHAVLKLKDGLDAVREPSFKNRFFVNFPLDPIWAAKNRIGRDFYGLSFHSLFKYLPPKTYFKDHPEWYPEKKGVRRHGTTDWLCWSNREMRKELAKVIREELRTGKLAPDHALALGQGDGPAKCTCAECEKIKEEYGSDSAVMLLACNEIAEEVAKEFPERKIAVFAYFNTQKPPTKAFKLHRNLVVNYVHTRDHMKSLFHPKYKEFADDMLRWDDFENEITVWDWNVDFGNTLMPFPNIKARAEDIRFFRKWKNVTTMAPQILDSGDFIELRKWLFARMMWDVHTDIEVAEREFMTGYFGQEAGMVLDEYLRKFQKYAEEDPGAYNAIFDGKEGALRKTLFTPERIADAESIFRRAMAAAEASGDTNRLERVRLSYLRGFAAIRLSDVKALGYAEKNGRRYLLPGGDASLAEAVVGIGDLILRAKAKMDEYGGELFQLSKFTRLYGAELDSHVENDRIAMDGASAMSGGIMRLVDKKTGLDMFAADAPGLKASHGFQHRIGWSTLPRKGRVSRVGKVQEYRTFGNCGTSIWWTPNVLPIERVFTIADGERGFTMRTSMAENRKAHFAFTTLKDWFKYDVPFFTPQIGMLLTSSAPTKSKVFVTDGKGGRYAMVKSSAPLEINIASNEHKTVWILDPDPKRPVVRIDTDDNVWGKITIVGVKKSSALRVSLEAREKLTVHDDNARVSCGGISLHLMDRAEAEARLPSDASCAEKMSTVSAGELNLKGVFGPDVRTIGIVSVSHVISSEQLVRGTNMLVKAGYKVKVMPNVLKLEAPEVRARFFERAWLDQEIDFLLFSRGGRGAEEVVGCIDWELLKARDMRVMGFSDVTVVLCAMLKKGVGCPISGPMVTTLASYCSQESCDWLRGLLDGSPKSIKLLPVKCGQEEVCGKPVGGLMERFPMLFGKGFLPPFDGRIVFLESTPKYADTSEALLDGLLSKGFFEKAAAVVFCDFNSTWEKARVESLIERFASKVPCPVFSGYPYGHVARSFAFDFTRPLKISREGVLEWGI